MTELARIHDDPTAPVVYQPPARTDTDSWVQVVADVARLADHIAETEFVPRALRGNAPAAAAAILYGREVGLPPMTALSQTHVIEGKPALSAEAMRAMILAAGHEIEFVESTGATCTIRGRRRGSERWYVVSWNLDMARAAGLLPGKERSAWRTYPRAMLKARATAELARDLFPDVIHGFAAVEELADTEPTPAGQGSDDEPRTKVQRRPRRTPPAQEPAPAEAEEFERPPLPGEQPEQPETSGRPLPAAGHDEEGPDPAGPVSAGSSSSGGGSEGSRSPSGSPPPQSDRGPVEEDAPARVAGSTAAPSPAEPLPVRGDGEATEAPPSTDQPATNAGDRANAGSAGDHKEPPPKPMTQAQSKMIMAQLGKLGVDTKDDQRRHYIAGRLLGREVESFKHLNRRDASQLNDTLARFERGADLDAFLDAIDQPPLEEPQDEEGDQ